MLSRRLGSCVRLSSRRAARRFAKGSGPASPSVEAPAFARFVDRPVSDLWKAGVFTAAGVGVSFTAGVVWAHESSRSERRRKRSFWDRVSGKAGEAPPKGLYERAKEMLGSLAPAPLAQWWSKQSEGQRLVLALVAANVGVFVAWKTANPAFMYRYFASSFYGERLLAPMLLSNFSHSAPLHLAANMYVLHSFGGMTADRWLGRELFLALFVSGGLASSLASHAFRALARSPSYSVGASGAVLACLVFACCKMPEARLSIIFLPFFDFSAAQAVLGILALDTAGLALGWRLFDHAAHLGGSLFGLGFAFWGLPLLHLCAPAITQAWTTVTRRGDDDEG